MGRRAPKRHGERPDRGVRRGRLALRHRARTPNAVEIDWVEDLNDLLMRDYLDSEKFAALMSEKGISPEMKVVFYGDKNN